METRFFNPPGALIRVVAHRWRFVGFEIWLPKSRLLLAGSLEGSLFPAPKCTEDIWTAYLGPSQGHKIRKQKGNGVDI